jgi:AcrR family transcriptional regulator
LSQSLRERKKTQLRDRLAAEARRLFLERGYDATTVDDIAAAADVSRRTFFRYFETKEDVLFEEHGPRLAAFGRLLGEAAAERRPALAAVHAAISSLFEAGIEKQRRAPESFDLPRRIARQVPALAARVRAFDLDWEAAIAAHLRSAHDEAEAALLAAMIVGGSRAVIRRWETAHYRTDPVAEIAALFRLIAPKAAKR